MDKLVNFEKDRDQIFIVGLDLTNKNVGVIYYGRPGRLLFIYNMFISIQAWTAPHPMFVKKTTSAGYAMVIVALNLPRERVVGRDVEYKYRVVTPAGEYWEKLSIPGEFGNPVINRVLLVPKGFSSDVYEKYDDVIMKDNDKDRRTARLISTKYLLPAVFGNIKNISNQSKLIENVRKFEHVVESHLNSILFKLKMEGNPWWNTPQASLKSYDVNVRSLLKAYCGHYFKVMSEKLDDSEKIVASLFFILLSSSSVNRHLPTLEADEFDILLSPLKPRIMVGMDTCTVIDTLEKMIEPPYRADISFALETAINRFVKLNYFKNAPQNIFSLLPILHFLHGYPRPSFKEAHSKPKVSRDFWGFYDLSIDILKAIRDSKGGTLASMSMINDYSKIDPVIKHSYLRCLTFPDFLTLVKNYSQHFDLVSILAFSTVWFNKEHTAAVNFEVLAKVLLEFTKKNISTELVCFLGEREREDLFFVVKYISKQFFRSPQLGVTLYGLDILVTVFKSIPVDSEDSLELGDLSDLCGDNLLRLCPKNYDRLKKLLPNLSKAVLIVEPVKERMMGPILHKASAEINQSLVRRDQLIDAYLNLSTDDTAASIIEILESTLMGIVEKDFQSLFSSLVSYIPVFGNYHSVYKSGRLANLLARIFSATLRKLDQRLPNSVLEYALKNEVFIKILNLNKETEGKWILEYFPKDELNQLRTIIKKAVETLNKAAKSEATVEIYNFLSSEDGKSSLRKRLPLITAIEASDIPQNTLLREILLRCQELGYYKEFTAKIVKFLHNNNGRLNNYNFFKIIDEFPNEKRRNESVLGNIILPRRNEEEALKPLIRKEFLENEKLISTYMECSQSMLFKDCIDSEFNIRNEMNSIMGNNLRQDEEDFDEFDAEEEEEPLAQLFDVLEKGMEKFKEIVESLRDCNMSLVDVQKYFLGQWKKPGDLEHELHHLELLFPSKTPGEYWSGGVGSKIDCLFQLTSYTSIADTLIKVSKLLGMKKPLREIEKIVRIKDYQQEEVPISSITNEDLRCGEIFSKWSQEEIKSLEVIEKSIKFIRWIRESMENFQEFKFFVDLASISAGESDTEVDRVMFMQAAVSAYSALIFDIKEDSTLTDLIRAAQHLFAAVKEDKNVPDKILDTNRHLEWIKLIKERHGSVETSSLQQVEAINKTGVYVIGNFHKKGMKTLTLKFEQMDRDHELSYEKEMSTDDLKELQSKLMLISKSDDAAKEVQRFVSILSVALRVERGIKKMFEAGCNLTRRMSVWVHCDTRRRKKV